MKSLLKKVWLVAVVYGLVITIPMNAQDGGMLEVNYNTANVINGLIKLPKSPEADAFEKYGNTQVNLYTGTPEINIPLHTLKGRELEVPMSLTYDATGIKVSQIATNVGLGWSLNFGGRISRIASGKPDDILGGTYNDNFLLAENRAKYNFDSEYELDQYLNDYMLPAVNGLIDTELDLYSLNAIGINDYIYFDLENKTPRTLLNPRIQINYNGSQNQWIITAENGTEYYFGFDGKKEITTVSGGDDVGVANVYSGNSVTSWLLTKIISKNKLDEFEFDYKLYTWDNNYTVTAAMHKFNWKVTCPPGWYGSPEASYNTDKPYKVSQQMPLSVKHNGRYLAKFKYKSREDLLFVANAYQDGNALDKILFYKYMAPVTAQNFESTDGSLFYKEVSFKHSYFGTVPPNKHARLYKRLKLDGINIHQEGAREEKTYSFLYRLPEQVPGILSFSQDFWGLYNGASNASLIPSARLGSNSYFSGANRDFNFQKATIGMLERITYPTKGYTTFEFEQNKSNDNLFVPTYNYIDEDVVHYAYGPLASYWCDGVPDQYQNKHSSMNSIYFPYFGLPNNYSNNYYLYNVRTDLMTVTEDFDYLLQTGGTGVYLIQKVNCTNTAFENYGCYTDFNETTEINFYPCLHPTTELFITKRNNAAFTSHPSEFVKGDFTWNTQTKEVLHLTPGTYQVTMWSGGYGGGDYPNPPEPEPWIKIFKPTPSSIPEHTVYRTKDAEGFRIKTIKDYTSKDVLAVEKSYEYRLDENVLNSSGVRIAERPQPMLYSVQSVQCTGTLNYNPDTGIVAAAPSLVITTEGVNTYPYFAYSSVYEVLKDDTNTIGSTQYKFNVGENGLVYKDNGLVWFEPVYENGKIAEKNIFDKNGKIRSSELYFYKQYEFYSDYSKTFRRMAHTRYAYVHDFPGGLSFTDGTINNGGQLSMPGPAPCPSWLSNEPWSNCQLGKYSYFAVSQNFYGRYGFLSRKHTTTYPDEDRIDKTEDFHYEEFEPFMLSSKEQTSSTGFLREDYIYSGSNPEKITDIITSSEEGEISYKHNVYEDYGAANFVNEIMLSKGGQPLESRIKFDFDPSSKNPVTTLISTGNNNPANTDYDCYIFGYNDMFPVAKLTGVKYSQIPGALIQEIRDRSAVPITVSGQALLMDSLQELRLIFPHSMVTTYLYDPMLGVTSQTDPNKLTTYYEYDELGRLKRVLDNDHNILSENRYHYRN